MPPSTDAAKTLGFSGVKFGEPLTTENYVVFISSSDEVAHARRRIKNLIDESINPPLADRSRAQLYPRMWERATAQVAPGKTVNELFVEGVETSHAAMVLLKTQLGAGTEEEVEAVLDLPAAREVWLSVLRFALDDGETPSEDPRRLDDFLGQIGEDHRVLYHDTGALDSEEAWYTIVKTLTQYALAAFEKSGERDRTDVR